MRRPNNGVMGEQYGQGGFSCFKELSPQFFLVDFTIFLHFFPLFGRFGGGVLQWGSGMFPILGLTFLLYSCILFDSTLVPLITSNG